MIRRNSLLFLSLFLTVFVFSMIIPYSSPPALAAPFTDVGNDNPNKAYINYVSELGLMTGYPDGGFHANDSISRAQAAVIIVKTMKLNVNPNTTSGFKDVPTKHWAAPYIGTAVQAGYLTGMSDGSFRPNDSLNRAQGISLLLRLSKQPDSGVALPSISDVDEKHWAARSIAIGLDAGMIDLGADNSFNPDAAMTRGDLAKALAVLLSNDPNLSAQSLKGSLVSLAGEVVIVHLDKDKTLPLANSCPVEIGDTVKTGDKGKAKIDFPDGSSLLLENNTELLFKKMQGKAYIKKSGTPGTGVDFLEVELHKGQLFGGLSSFRRSIGDVALNSRLTGSLVCSVNKFDLLAAADSGIPWYKTAEKKKVKVVVDMPWGVSAIRGSFWSNLCTDQLNTMTLLEGSGELSAGNKTRELSPNQGSQIASEGAQPGVTSSMSSAEQMNWAGEKDWIKSTAAKMDYNQEYGLKENAGNSLKDIINNSMDNLYDGGSGSGGGGGCGGC